MGQKPYQCSDCGEKFSQTSNLAKHMRKHGQYHYPGDHLQVKLTEDTNENSSMSEEGASGLGSSSHDHHSIIPSSSSTSLCYSNSNGNTNGHPNNNNSNIQPISLVNAESLRLNAFFTNHHSKLSFDSMDSKFITG